MNDTVSLPRYTLWLSWPCSLWNWIESASAGSFLEYRRLANTMGGSSAHAARLRILGAPMPLAQSMCSLVVYFLVVDSLWNWHNIIIKLQCVIVFWKRYDRLENVLRRGLWSWMRNDYSSLAPSVVRPGGYCMHAPRSAAEESSASLKSNHCILTIDTIDRQSR